MTRVLLGQRHRRAAWALGGLLLNILLALVAQYLAIMIAPTGPSTRSPVARVKSDLRSIEVSLKNYHADHGAYPAWGSGANGTNRDQITHAPLSVPTFRVWADADEAGAFATLTTPVSYLTSLIADPFTGSGDRRAFYGYYAEGPHWILFSAGPDGDYDIDLPREWDASVWPPLDLFIAKSYDPTNGKTSSGDIIRYQE